MKRERSIDLILLVYYDTSMDILLGIGLLVLKSSRIMSYLNINKEVKIIIV